MPVRTVRAPFFYSRGNGYVRKGETAEFTDREIARGDELNAFEEVTDEAGFGNGVGIDAHEADVTPEPEVEPDPYEHLSVAELKAELDDIGVDYPSSAKKAELQALLAEAEAPEDD